MAQENDWHFNCGHEIIFVFLPLLRAVTNKIKMSMSRLFILLQILILSLCLVKPPEAFAANGTGHDLDISHDLAKLHDRLGKAKIARDSVDIMLEIYDILPTGTQHDSLSTAIYNLAVRAGESGSALDILRSKARHAQTAEEIEQLKKLVKAVPGESNIKKATFTYIKLYGTLINANSTTEDSDNEKVRNITKLINEYSTLGSDESEEIQRVELLFNICIYLNANAPGSILSDKIVELDGLIQKLPEGFEVVEALFYNMAISSYLAMGQRIEAIKYCKRFLKLIDRLETMAKSTRRSFMSLDRYRFRVYRRLISAYKIIPDPEVYAYLDRVQEIIARDPECRREYYDDLLCEVFYAMNEKKYPEAIRLFKGVIDNPKVVVQWPAMVGMYVEAARMAGDQDALLHALTVQNNMYLNRLGDGTQNTTRELRILYNSNNQRKINMRLQERNQALEAQQRERTTRYLVLIGCLLFIALIILLLAYGHQRALTSRLGETYKSLVAERDAMSRAQNREEHAVERLNAAQLGQRNAMTALSTGIANPAGNIISAAQMVIDTVGTPPPPFLVKHIKIIEHNMSVLQTLVGDIIDSNDADLKTMTLHLNNFSLSDTLNTAIDMVRPNLKHGVTISLANVGPDISSSLVDSDPQRIEQIVSNLLSNAVKFTGYGHITVTYGIDRENATATVAVQDTGTGIPHEHHEDIFARYTKLDKKQPGLGLGLYVAKMTALKLGGTLSVDPTYLAGARFVFTFPIAANQQ